MKNTAVKKIKGFSSASPNICDLKLLPNIDGTWITIQDDVGTSMAVKLSDLSDFIKADVFDKIRTEIKGWQDDIHDNENDADEHDFVFERIFEIFDEYRESEVKRMSKFNVGDKVYLECKVTYKDASDNTYQIRYKNWHDNELPTDFVKDDILHTPDEAYNRGLNDAWNLAKKIVLPEDKGGYTADELEDIFGKSAFTTLTAQEALAKVKAYGEECNEIKVGDEIQSGDAYVVVTWKSKDEWNGMLLNDCDCGKAGACYTLMKGFTDWHKTGRHYHQISEILSQTKGEAE